ncbi:hypothetical protein [Paenibacillus dakarensis]|uniref:hypothetical protein n=1 Tax=Paenibacillus dakarensis TaxID=1527293 RepID=UPI0006D52F6D|nr:hypothetical protein [Paenibacillus dakarensis]
MANVQLPSFNTTPSDIDNSGMDDLKKHVKSLLNSTIQLNEELTFLLNNLDTRNVNELNAEVITAGSITADKIQANSIDTAHLRADAVTAEKINVNELSAIAANLGHIISGLVESVEIYGSYIATRRGAFPRSEMSNQEHLFAAYRNESNFVKISPDLSGAPGVRFTVNGAVLGSLNTYLGYLELWGPSILKLTAPTVRVNNWSSLRSDSTGLSLQQELDSIWSALNSKANSYHTHTVTIPNHNHGNPDNQNSGGGTFNVT